MTCSKRSGQSGIEPGTHCTGHRHPCGMRAKHLAIRSPVSRILKKDWMPFVIVFYTLHSTFLLVAKKFDTQPWLIDRCKHQKLLTDSVHCKQLLIIDDQLFSFHSNISDSWLKIEKLSVQFTVLKSRTTFFPSHISSCFIGRGKTHLCVCRRVWYSKAGYTYRFWAEKEGTELKQIPKLTK